MLLIFMCFFVHHRSHQLSVLYPHTKVMPTHVVSTVSARAALKPRREPYWQKLSQGWHLGFRKLSTNSEGVWWARHIEPGTNLKKYRALGPIDHVPNSRRFDTAKQLAEEWFEHLGRGGVSSAKTVRDACDHYVQHIRETKGRKAAEDVAKRFSGYVINLEGFASCELSKLTPTLIGEWRRRLANLPVMQGIRGRSRASTEQVQRRAEPRMRTSSTLNRDITPFRAALNLALREGWVTSDFAWRTKLTPIKGADVRRDLYLDKAQRSRLIASAPAEVRGFLQGLALLPLRPGALASLRVDDFDSRLAQLSIRVDKTGSRKITLPPATAGLIQKHCADKPRAAPIFSRHDGSAWNKDSWKGPIKDAVLASDLPARATAYTIRHSVITDLVHSGLDLLTVAQISGTSVRMIEAHYGHLRSAIALPALTALTL
jgi:integrase